MSRVHSGSCHCGAVRFSFVSARQLAPRACQCSFCRKHGARSVSDPHGSADLTLAADVLRYRFATRSSDYIVCGRCGVYVGGVAEIGSELFATLNLNAFDDPRLDLAAASVSYEGETADAKAERRRRNWTPARIAGPSV